MFNTKLFLSSMIQSLSKCFKCQNMEYDKDENKN